MTNIELLKMIEENLTLEEIIKKSNMSYKQLHYRLNLLKNNGYNINTRYYDDGDISYEIANDYVLDNDVIIKTEEKKNFRAMLVSDLHLASNFENLDLLDKIYDYCIIHDIHTIINAGDLINIPNSGYLDINEVRNQINYMLDVHPFDKNILNFICLGNHDFNVFRTGLNISEIIKSQRYDLIPMGYGYSRIFVQNDKIAIYHTLKTCENSYGIEKINDQITTNNNLDSLRIIGHSHKTRYRTCGGFNYIWVPSLSKNNNGMSGAIEMELVFKINGTFREGIFKQLIYNGKEFYPINCVEVNLNSGKNNKFDSIPNTYKRVKK